MKSLIYFLFLGILSPLGCTTVHAAQIDLDAILGQAQFVFEGTVQRVEYQLSEPTNGNVGIPYTFVTYSVERIYKGNYNGAALTLRFFGGPTGKNGHLMLSPNYPLFDQGDHDILLVTGNAQSECPLVGCAMGRFRFLDGMVVNEFGQTLSFNEDGSIRTQSTIKNDAISKHTIDGKISLDRKGSEPSSPKEEPSSGYDKINGDDSYLEAQKNAAEAEEAANEDQAPPEDVITQDRFSENLTSRLVEENKHKSDEASVANAEYGQPFFSPGANPVAGPNTTNTDATSEDKNLPDGVAARNNAPDSTGGNSTHPDATQDDSAPAKNPINAIKSAVFSNDETRANRILLALLAAFAIGIAGYWAKTRGCRQ